MKREGQKRIYHCKGCNNFSTDDIGAFIQHVIDERLAKEGKEPKTPPPKKGHKTVEEYLNCPECYPAFEKAFLERGYKKKAEKNGF